MDSNELELTRRRLEDEVRAKVESSLFRYYRNLGSAIIAALAAVGFFVGWPALKSQIDREVQSQISKQVSEPVRKANEAAEQARTSAAEADKVANVILGRLEERQASLREAIGHVNARYDEAAVNLGTTKSRLAAINDQVADLEEAIRYFRDLAKRDPVGRLEIESLKESIAKVAASAGELAKVIGSGGSTADNAGLIDTTQEQLNQVVTDQTQAIDAIDNATTNDPRGASTVFVQFAGGAREDIKSVTAVLRQQGWNVPGEERIASAAGKREIRYFHEGDRLAASLLRDDLNSALQSVGFSALEIREVGDPTVVAKMPAKGILEIWVQVPGR